MSPCRAAQPALAKLTARESRKTSAKLNSIQEAPVFDGLDLNTSDLSETKRRVQVRQMCIGCRFF